MPVSATVDAAKGSEEARRSEKRGERASQVLGIAATRFILFPLSMVVGILVTRQLGPENRGAFAFVSLVTAFGATLFQFGFANGIRYFVSAGEARAKECSVTAFLGGAGLGLVGAVLIAIGFANGLLGESARMLSWKQFGPVIASFPLLTASMALSYVLLGDSRFGVTKAVQVGRDLTMLLFLVAGVLLGGLGLSGAIWALIASQVLSGAATVVVVVVFYRPNLAFDLVLSKRSLAYGIRVWLGSLAARSNDRLDQLLLSLVGTPGQLGLYSVAVRMAELPLMAGTFVTPVLFNRIAATRDVAERATLAGRIHRLQFFVAGASILALGLAGKPLVPALYGAAFSSSVPILWLYLPGIAAAATQQVLGTVFSGGGRPGLASTTQLVGLLIGLVTLLPLVSWIGGMGAALGSSLAYCGAAVSAILLHRRLVGEGVLRHLFRVRGADLRWGASALFDGATRLRMTGTAVFARSRGRSGGV